MNNSAKYQVREDKQQMVSEPTFAYTYNNRLTKGQFAFSIDRGDMETAITGMELKNRLHESLKSRF